MGKPAASDRLRLHTLRNCRSTVIKTAQFGRRDGRELRSPRRRSRDRSGAATTWAAKPSAPGPEPDEHRIRQRAYQIWVEEGKPDGRALDHWMRARWELGREPSPQAELERLEHDFKPGRKTD